MERHKQVQRNYYNTKAKRLLDDRTHSDWINGSKRFGEVLGSHFRFAEEEIRRIRNMRPGRPLKLLDYGCGTGTHSIFPATLGIRVYGIDISQNAIIAAKERSRKAGTDAKTTFTVMDAEALSFPRHFFDIVCSYDTLAHLERTKAIQEILRVLKPDGYMISVDTLGRNPVIAMRQRIALWRHKGAAQLLHHTTQLDDIENMKKYFVHARSSFFHFFTLLAAPLERWLGISTLGSILARIDQFLLRFRFFQIWAFKAVTICSQVT